MTDKTADDILKLVADENVEYIDIQFCDLPGAMQHLSIPAAALDADVFENGVAFDGSSIRGFQSIHESDMMLLPDFTTAQIDPFRAAKTLNLNFFVHDPFTREPYSRDPRNIARKAESYLANTGIADTAYFGAEAEFYIFDSVAFDSQMNGTFYEVDSDSGWWNAGSPTESDGRPNRGYKTRPKGGYFPVSPVDSLGDLRADSLWMESHGFDEHNWLVEAGKSRREQLSRAGTRGSIEMVIESDPDMATTTAAAGYTVLLFARPPYRFAARETRLLPTGWSDLTDELDRQAKAKAENAARIEIESL